MANITQNPEEEFTTEVLGKTPEVSTPTPEVPADKVLIDKVTLDNILERLAAVEEKGSTTQKRVSIKRNRTAKVRFVDDEKTKLVVGYGKSWEKTDLGGRRYLVIEVFSEDVNDRTKPREKTEVEGVKFVEQGPFEEAEIVSVKTEEITEELGYVNETKLDYDNYRSYQTDKTIPMVVVSQKNVYSMKRPNGQVVEVPEEGLN